MKNTKKFLSIILAILMIVTTVPFAFAAVETPPTREIDGKTFYELDSADDLYWFAEYVNAGNYTANAILTADITVNENLMSKITLDEEGNAQVNEGVTVREWISIGNADNIWDGARFAGEFNGNGKVVSGVYMNSENVYDGFFGVVNSNAYIHNFTMRGSYICSGNAAGFVCALTHGANIRLENLVNESTIRGWRAAGIVAMAGSGGTITNCVNKGTIYGDYDDYYDNGYREAGIAESSINHTQIINCYNVGDVEYAIGGDVDDGLIIDCYYLDSASASGVNERWGQCGGTTAKTAEDFANGAVCELVGYHIGGVDTCASGKICETCGFEYGEVDADNHKDTLVQVDEKAPTCTEVGYEAYEYCTACDYTTYVEKEALNHKDTIVQVEAKAPTCTEIGWDAYEYCTACDYTTYVEKAALDHDIVIDAYVAPKCEETGLTEGQHCSRCDDMTVAQEVIPDLGGHINEDGNTTCDRCGETILCEDCGRPVHEGFIQNLVCLIIMLINLVKSMF